MITNPFSWFLRRVVLLLALLISPALMTATDASEVKLEIQLIWGTDADSSPDPTHKAIEKDLASKFKHSPFKWKNYYQVKRRSIGVAPAALQKVEMSKDCTLEIRNVGDNRMEVKLFGKDKDKFVSKQTEPLSNYPLIIAGNAGNDTAWFIVIKAVK